MKTICNNIKIWKDMCNLVMKGPTENQILKQNKDKKNLKRYLKNSFKNLCFK